MTVLVALGFLIIGFFLGRRQIEKEKTPLEITVGVLRILNRAEYKPLGYREICEDIGAHTKRERQLVFEELMRLAEEGTVQVSEEACTRRMYRKHVNILA